MSDTNTLHAKHTDLEPSVFPSDAEMTAWQKLTPQQQRAAIMHKVEKGLRGPASAKAAKDDIMAELRAERGA